MPESAVQVSGNATGGQPSSLADRKAVAARIVGAHPHWSDRRIATAAGLSAATVARIRLRRAEPDPPDRLGHDGRTRPVNARERRRHARSLLLDEPTLSLREVARRAGLSPETVRSVRAQLHRGEPAPAPEPGPDPTAVLAQLRGDPRLRFSESGRELLRLLDLHTMPARRWAASANTVPPHCRDAAARVARECARAWHTFAERLERTTATEAS